MTSAARTVHPRSRGEHHQAVADGLPRDGSSPLARGTQLRHALAVLQPRFIPARAGNTWSGSTGRGGDSVHPRSRGEHLVEGSSTRIENGSSPLARGTPLLSRRRERRLSVHPRSRGEHPSSGAEKTRPSGSSPLARGTLSGPRLQGLEVRFIPARAGNTSWTWPSASPSPVHPRSRGEHCPRFRTGGTGTGSSPLARGTRTFRDVDMAALRFIPARAGNTAAPGA